MGNPIKAPNSELDAKSQRANKKVWWKVLFWVALFIKLTWLPLAFVVAMAQKGEHLITFPFEVLLYSLILIGVYGYSYDKNILNKYLWLLLIPIGAFYDSYIIIEYELWRVTDLLVFETSGSGAVALTIPILILQYVALFKYSSEFK